MPSISTTAGLAPEFRPSRLALAGTSVSALFFAGFAVVYILQWAGIGAAP